MEAPPNWATLFSQYYTSFGKERVTLRDNLRTIYERLSTEEKVAAQRLTARLDKAVDRNALLHSFATSDATCWKCAQYYVCFGQTPIPLHASSDAKSAGKIPCLLNWTWLPLLDLLFEIRRIAEVDPLRNLGLRTGPDLFVLDFDYKPSEGKDGLALLAELEQRFNDGQPFHTPTVITGGGGRHLYFQATDLPSVTGLCGGRLDLRSYSGQAVAPGSTHKRTGRPYEFATGLMLHEVPILPLPAALREWLVAERPKKPVPTAPAHTAPAHGALAHGAPAPLLAPTTTPAKANAFEHWQQPPIELLEELLLQLCHLQADYCVNRDRWLTILWILKRHHPTLDGLALAHRFSSWAGSVYDASGVETKWAEGRTQGPGPTIGTLMTWLRSHSMEAYQLFREKWKNYFGRFSTTADNLLYKGQAGFAEVATGLLKATFFTASEHEAYGWCPLQKVWKSLSPDEVCVRVRDALEAFMPNWKASFRADIQERIKSGYDPAKLAPRLLALDRLREPHLNWGTLRGVANYVAVLLRDPNRAALLNDASGTEWLLPIGEGLMVDLRQPPGPDNPRPRNPEDLFSRAAPVCYRIGADVSRWEKIFHDNHFDHHVDERRNQEIVTFRRQWLAYNLTADTQAQLFAEDVGPTASNGKSTEALGMRSLLGDFFQAVPHSLFLDGRQPAAGAPRSDVMAIRGKRCIWGAEPPLSSQLDGGLFKKVIGGDPIAERDLHQRSSETRSFRCIGKFNVSSNGVIGPKQSSDTGILRKMLIFYFRTHYTSQPSRPFDKLCDPALATWVSTPEASSSLLLLVWRETPNIYRFGLRRPDWMTARVDELRHVNSASDGAALDAFLDECCLVWPHYKQDATVLKQAYFDWWRDKNPLSSSRLPTEASLQSDLERRGYAYSVSEKFSYFGDVYLLPSGDRARWQSVRARQISARERLGEAQEALPPPPGGPSHRNKSIRNEVSAYLSQQEQEAGLLEAKIANP